MKNKIFNLFIIFICSFIFIMLLIKKSLIYKTILYALNMWVKNLIPAMFPFFIIADILINYNITNYISNFFKRVCKHLFGITDNMLTILVLSMLSGFPSNARNTRIMYDKGLINVDEANHILMFSHFSNPLFILTTVGLFFFKEEILGLIILISHYSSNFILGIVLRKSFKHDYKNNTIVNNNSNNFGTVVVEAIKRSIDTTLLICGIVTLFLILSTIVVDILNCNLYNEMLIKGLFEITIGIEALGKLGISSRYKAIIASCFLAFGGLSVHMQVISQITDTEIKYNCFFIGRILQTIISLIITLIICIIIGI